MSLDDEAGVGSVPSFNGSSIGECSSLEEEMAKGQEEGKR
jgi:hypothetical protein